MKHALTCSLLGMLLLLLVSCTNAPSAVPADPAKSQAAIEAIMDSMQTAWSQNRVADYVNYFTADAQILGTDPSEKWTKASFTEYYQKIVAAGFKGDHTVNNAFVLISPDG